MKEFRPRSEGRNWCRQSSHPPEYDKPEKWMNQDEHPLRAAEREDARRAPTKHAGESTPCRGREAGERLRHTCRRSGEPRGDHSKPVVQMSKRMRVLHLALRYL
jgi:hypothetical protein